MGKQNNTVKFGVPGFFFSAVPVFRSVPECSGVFRGVPGCSGVPVFRCSGVPVFRCSGVPVFRCSGVPVFRCSGVPVFRCSGVPVFRCSGVPVFRCSGVPVFRCSGVPVFRCSGVPGFSICLINPVDETKLSCYTSHRRSTTVSLETSPLFFTSHGIRQALIKLNICYNKTAENF